MRGQGGVIGLLSTSAAVWLATAPGLHAQALEHYLPPAPKRVITTPSVRVNPPPEPANLAIGPVLTGVTLVPLDSQASLPSITEGWSSLLGQPLSPALIHTIESGVQQRYAALNYAVVARWTPDAAAPSGVVRIVVAPLIVGEITVTNGRPGQAAYIQRRLGVTAGQTIDATRFADDLASLSRYPYRETQAVFTPRAGSAVADLDLVIKNHKPWGANFGFKYGGSKDLTYRRYFAGLSVGNLVGHDSLLAVQLTGSPDVALHEDPHPKFKEGVVTYSLPVARRTRFEASLDISELNFHFAPSTYRIIDTMAQAGVRLDLGSRPGGVTRDLRYGLEAKNELELIFTNSVLGTRMAAEVFQAYAGYHRARTTDTVQDDFDIVAHVSPGGLDPGNTNRHALVYSEGRQKSQTYAYVGFAYDRTQILSKTLDWHSQISGQVATGPLPFSEQAGLGGLSQVRGYYFIDGSYDTAVVVRNELIVKRGPRPYVFYDCGMGRDIGLHHSDVLASVGAGANFHVGNTATLRLEALRTLRPGQFTQKNTETLLGNLTFRF